MLEYKHGGIGMKKEWLEYIKVGSFVVIAISLAVIAWQVAFGVSYLEEIWDHLQYYGDI
ncbi:hypothetical protein [Bacillus sp. THAF10]|uniref:hypothetical protein n=1 Tax=Bacillus sp. THAF10 TaxID=2587848 RepID=UPI001C12A9E9|nr:hypothetical protein [Bacillus sp. THAF10]